MADKTISFPYTFQTAAVATGNGTAADVGGLAELSIQIVGITSATVTFEANGDDATWVSVYARNVTTGLKSTTATADGIYKIPCATLSQVRARISTWVSGTITITGRGTTTPGDAIDILPTGANSGQVQGTAASGAAPAGSPVEIAGLDLVGNVRSPVFDTTTGLPLPSVNRLSTGTLDGTSTASAVTVNTQGCGTVGIYTTGASGFTATARLEGTTDGGTTWSFMPFHIINSATGPQFGSSAVTANTAANVFWKADCGEFQQVRLRVATAAAGTIVATLIASPAAFYLPPYFISAADTVSAPNAQVDLAFTSLFNGASWDRERANTDVTLLASGARGTTQTSADLVNYNARALYVILDITAGTTPLLTVSVNAKDGASGKYYQLHTNFTQVAAISTSVYELSLGAAAAAGGITAVSSHTVPRTFQIVVTVGNANSITYSLGYSLVR